jgi:hypothetical protein
MLSKHSFENIAFVLYIHIFGLASGARVSLVCDQSPINQSPINHYFNAVSTFILTAFIGFLRATAASGNFTA